MSIQFPQAPANELLLDVTRFANLQTPDGNFTAAAEAAAAYAAANGFDGIYFPPRDQPYYISSCHIPGQCNVRSHQNAQISPVPTSSTGAVVFIPTGNNIEFELRKCLGIGGTAQDPAFGNGFGAVITAEIIFGGIDPGGDSLNDDFSVPVWTPDTAYHKETSPGAGDGSRVRHPVYNTIWVAQADHTSGSDFATDIALGYWIFTSKGLELRYGGQNYVTTGSDGIGNFFDYAVTDGGGTGGILRCYVVSGTITRVITHTSGTGYTPDFFQGRNIMLVGRPRPFQWVQALDKNDIRILRSTFRFGKNGVGWQRGFRCRSEFNTFLDFSHDAFPCGATDCDVVSISWNLMDGFSSGLHNCGGISFTGLTTDPIPQNIDCKVIGNTIRNGWVNSDVGIETNVAVVKGLIIAENQVSNCGGIGVEVKHGANANASTPGTVPEYEAGVRGIVITGNNIRVPAGGQGLRLHNNLRDPEQASVDPSNTIECVGARKNAVGVYSVAMVTLNGSDSTYNPTVRGRFTTGILVQTATRCTFDPVTDGRCYTVISSVPGNYFMRECYFPGEYLSARSPLALINAINCQFAGTRAITQGQSVFSAAVNTAGLGGPPNASLQAYANGGGYGLELGCTVVDGVITAAVIMPTIQEKFYGAMLLGGKSGTFPVKIKQSGGSGGILTVTVVNGAATGVVVTAGGTGFLSGGSTAVNSNMNVIMGRDFAATVKTDVTGAVTSITVDDGGGYFVDVPDLVFDNSVVWGTPPTFTLTMLNSLGSTPGLYLQNGIDNIFSGARFEGYAAGLYLVPGTNFNNAIYNTVIKSAFGEPYNNTDIKYLGTHHNITQVYASGWTLGARLPDGNILWSRGEDNLVDTSTGAQLIKTIRGCRGRTTIRLSNVAHTLSFDNTDNLYLGGSASFVMTATTDWATFQFNPVTAKVQLVATNVGGQPLAGSVLTLAGYTMTSVVDVRPIIDLSGTWNNAAVAATAVKVNVTDTGSAAASLLLDLQKGGASVFNVTKTGQLNLIQDTIASAPAAVPALNIAGTWNNAAVTATLIQGNVTDTASAAGSLLMALQRNATTVFQVRKDGIVAIGPSFFSNNGLFTISANVTGGTTVTAACITSTVQSDVTSQATGFRTFFATAAAAFTCGTLYHFRTQQSTIGAGSTVTTQYGFYADSSMTGATNNYGFFTNLASGTNTFAFFSQGTAVSQFGGQVNLQAPPRFNGANSTGAGSALLGANCPAVTVSAPYKWISALASDGSAVFIPCWK